MIVKRVIVGDESDEALWRRIAIHTPEEVFGFFGPYHFLSNFFPVEIPYSGAVFPSSENAYQAVKFLPSVWHRFVDTTPAEAKYLAHCESMSQYKRFSEDEWEKRLKRLFMADIVGIKFGLKGDHVFGDDGPELQQLLLSTNNKLLLEGNWWDDTFWGVCINGAGERIGQNHLGRILMETREALRARVR
jgi:ribA/ribD-fused uncharacterized protein